MAQFKTAYLQREVIVDATVNKDCKVGDFVTLAGSALTVSAQAQATHIIAQSDMTISSGIKLTNRNQDSYTNKVSASTTNKKKVALYKIIDASDVIVDGDETAPNTTQTT